MKLYLLILSVFLLSSFTVISQSSDSVSVAKRIPQWGIEVNYGLLSYTESGLVSAGVVHTRGKHAFALSTHIWHHDLFPHPDDNWARLGAAFTYSFFLIGSHRMFAPYLFYDLNYGFHGVRREIRVTSPDGEVYGAVRHARNHTIAHHLGLGVRANIHHNLFVHLGIGAGPGSYGDVVNVQSRNPAFQNQRTVEHPFSRFEPMFMLRVGVVYQMDIEEWRRKGSAF